MTTDSWLHGALGLGADEAPFPWQQAVVERFLRGVVEGMADIPTGLGKTGVMAAWLVALGRGARVPRRLVYVVDRRAVVDQATEFAMKVREYVKDTPELAAALGLQDRMLPISTLRGEFADNREWLADPSSAAIVVGTVDMIGSRLLFEGYGVSRKMRPYHAGLLGADTLLVLDEAHLVPPFEHLIRRIASLQSLQPDALRAAIPTIKLLSLSATGRGSSKDAIRLSAADRDNPVVQKRLGATKRIKQVELGDDALHAALAREAWTLTEDGTRALRVIVFCASRDTAQKVYDDLAKRARGDKAALELFVGERRVHERAKLKEWMDAHGFLAGATTPRERPAILIATSAGEVGVDLDADHMVSDLVAWERMVQRFGRVNRRGLGSAEVVIVIEPEPEPDKKTAALLAKDVDDLDDKERELVAHHEHATSFARATRRAIERLEGDASPRALIALRDRAADDPSLQQLLDDATTPEPLHPTLSEEVIDAWSMTSLHSDPSRPEIAPWLRGWVDDEPQVSVVWRTRLPVRDGAKAREQTEYFEAAAPQIEEKLEAPAYRVASWLSVRAHEVRTRLDAGDADGLAEADVVAVVLSRAGEVEKTYTLAALDIESIEDQRAARKTAAELERKLREQIVVVDARLGGLTEKGLLDEGHRERPTTADSSETWKGIEFRVRIGTSDLPDDTWPESFRFVLDSDANGEPIKWLSVAGASTEERLSLTSRPQLLSIHQEWTQERARDIAARLALPLDIARAIEIAARLHDEGKRSPQWQRAFRAFREPDFDRDHPYAKTRGPVNVALLDGYRHELGSLPYAERDPEVVALSDELRDLVLHLIAAHHGHARPTIPDRGCVDGPPSVIRERTREVARRFMRLQRQWGPWGLAWLESLVRAADQLASKANDEGNAR